jgi:hypothetical protein
VDRGRGRALDRGLDPNRTTRSTRSCACCRMSLAPTRRRAPRPSSTCRRWR